MKESITDQSDINAAKILSAHPEVMHDPTDPATKTDVVNRLIRIGVLPPMESLLRNIDADQSPISGGAGF